MRRIFTFIALSLMAFCLANCKKFVEVGPPITSLASSNVFASDATAISALTSIYAAMGTTNLDGSGPTQPGAGVTSLSFFPGLSSDELNIINGQTDLTYIEYYKNILSTVRPLDLDFWNVFYPL